MNRDERKRVLIDRETVNEVIETGAVEVTWDGYRVVIRPDDIPKESPDDCCFRSKNMIDYYGDVRDGRECQNCGRVFDIHGNLQKITEKAGDEVLVFVPHSEFIEE